MVSFKRAYLSSGIQQQQQLANLSTSLNICESCSIAMGQFKCIDKMELIEIIELSEFPGRFPRFPIPPLIQVISSTFCTQMVDLLIPHTCDEVNSLYHLISTIYRS